MCNICLLNAMLLRSQGLLKTHNLLFSKYMLLLYRNSIGQLKFNSLWDVLFTVGRLCPHCSLHITYSFPYIHRHSPTPPSSLCSNGVASVTLYCKDCKPFPPSPIFFALHFLSFSYLLYLMSFSRQLGCKLH